MSSPATQRRAALGAGAPVVGRDFASAPRRGRGWLRDGAIFWVGAALVVGLAVVALRNDLIQMRYGMTAAMHEERELLRERRELVAHLRELRDPARLARLAEKRGFARPERVLHAGSREGVPR